MNLFQWLAANVFNAIGGLLLAFAIPLGPSVFATSLMDLAVFGPIGILLIGISYYYKFIKKY